MTQQPNHMPALRVLMREGRRSEGWASRPSGVRNATIRALLDAGLIEERAGRFPTYRVTAAGHAEIAAHKPFSQKPPQVNLG